MKNFVLVKRFQGAQARDLAIALQLKLDGATVAYSEGWSWTPTVKTYPNGAKAEGPVILTCGKCDVLAFRVNLQPDGGSDLYCPPDLRDWLNGGMEGDPPPPHLPEDGGIVFATPGDLQSIINAR